MVFFFLKKTSPGILDDSRKFWTYEGKELIQRGQRGFHTSNKPRDVNTCEDFMGLHSNTLQIILQQPDYQLLFKGTLTPMLFIPLQVDQHVRHPSLAN